MYNPIWLSDGKTLIMECDQCGAYINNRELHDKWHESLRLGKTEKDGKFYRGPIGGIKLKINTNE
jgi:hypothetical protein